MTAKGPLESGLTEGSFVKWTEGSFVQWVDYILHKINERFDVLENQDDSQRLQSKIKEYEGMISSLQKALLNKHERELNNIERQNRIKYQSIVYLICNMVDLHSAKKTTLETVVKELESILNDHKGDGH